MKYVLITGASTGIGYAAAEDLINHGYYVFGSVRKQEDADRLQRAFGERFLPLLFDVTDETGVKTAVSKVTEIVGSQGLNGLVNNAGIAVPGPLVHLKVEQVRHQLEVNVLGLLGVTKAFLPLLGANKESWQEPGRIINISSVSGRMAYPFFGAYAASKHALEAISDVLRRELLLYGIDVIVVNPGPIQTPIWDKAEALDFSPFLGTDYEESLRFVRDYAIDRGRRGMLVESVSVVIRRALEAKKPRTRYPVVRNRLVNWWLPHILLDRLLDRIIARLFRLR